MTQAVPLVSSPRRRWFRFLFQYSLRTLLIVTTLAGMACWWFLQPRVQEEELAGKFLKLRRQVKFAEVVPPPDVQLPGVKPTNVGSWQLRDENNDLLVAGRYQQDQPHGQWTTWHISGRNAAQGLAEHGVRSGVWRTWYENGRLQSEVSYRVVPFVPGLGDYQQVWRHPRYLELRPGVPKFGFQALRHGTARQWHANGQLHLDGSFQEDRREGPWTDYDEQGRVVEQGTYKADLREGGWTFPGRQVEYVAGLPKHEHEKLLDRIAADLLSGQVRRQVAAATMLEELGQAGAAVLAKLLDGGGSDDAKLLALRSLVRHDAVPNELMPKIEPLVDHTDRQMRMYAMLALYPHRPKQREELYQRLSELVESSSNFDLRFVVLSKLCGLDAERMPQTLDKLIALLAMRESSMPRLSGVSMGMLGTYDQFSENFRALLAMEIDLVPHLNRALDSPDAKVRLFVVKLLKEIVESGPPTKTTSLKSGVIETEWKIPQPFTKLVEKAKLDTDPSVRETAGGIGKRQSPAASGFF